MLRTGYDQARHLEALRSHGFVEFSVTGRMIALELLTMSLMQRPKCALCKLCCVHHHAGLGSRQLVYKARKGVPLSAPMMHFMTWKVSALHCLAVDTVAFRPLASQLIQDSSSKTDPL